MQELRADRLLNVPTDCESDKSSGDDDDVDSYFGSSASQKGRKRERLEVSDSDVNIYDDGDGGCSKTDDLRN
jgi:hypothetical protein